MYGIGMGTSNSMYDLLYGVNKTNNNRFNYAAENTKKLEKILAKRVENESRITKELNDYRKSAKDFYGEFYPKMNDLKEAASKLKNTSMTSVLNPTGVGSDNNKVADNVSGYIDSGVSIKLDVKQIATSQKNTYNSVVADEKGAFSGTNKVDINVGGKTQSFNFNISADKSNSDALKEMATQINNAKIGVTAQVVEKDGVSSFELIGNKTGSASEFSVAMQGNMQATLGKGSVSVASNAVYSVGGAEFTSQSNNIKLEGGKVSATLTGAGSANIGKKSVDQSQIVSSMSDFVQKYNDVVDYLSKNSEKSNKISSMAVSFSDTKYLSNALSKVGLDVDSSGKMTLNKANFETAMRDNPDMVKSYIGSSGGLAGSTFEKTSSAIINSSTLIPPPNGNRMNKFYGTTVGMLMDEYA